MKKIIYLVKSRQDINDFGVLKKVISQVQCTKKYGYDIKIYTFDILSSANKLNEINHIYLFRKDTKLNKIMKYFHYFVLFRKVERKILYEKPDIIYIRDYFYLFNLYSKLRKIAPVFVEIQTNMLSEIKTVSLFKFILEKYFRRRYFKKINGFICITKEIFNIERVYNRKPGIIIGNGINESDIGFIPKSEDNGYINLLFIGSPNLPWHGLERLVDSYKKAQNKQKFMLHIIGYEPNDNKYKDKNIEFYGFIKDSRNLERIFSVADIGVGTLALYKKNMKEAAPLKTRNYLSKGLPVIIGYEDIDLDNNLPFVFKVRNDNSNINFIKLELFYTQVKEYRENGYITEFTKKHLLWDNKVKKILYFIEKNL